MDNQTLRRLTPLSQSVEVSLRKATLHALDTEGSFSRAKLAQGIALDLGMTFESAERLGAGIELFHLSSLLFDDLPCMDNAEVRRSMRCAHRIYGDNSTILAALGLINQGYFHFWQVFSQCGKGLQDEASRLAKECLGFEGILDGQAKDLHFSPTRNDFFQVSEIAEKKTGSLLRLCLLLPAILGEAGRYEKLQLSNLACDWGLAYQVADDLKDVYYSKEVSGKTSQRDAKLGRPNMVLAIGEQAAVQLLNDLMQAAESKIKALKKSSSATCHTLLRFQSDLAGKVAPLLEAFAAA